MQSMTLMRKCAVRSCSSAMQRVSVFYLLAAVAVASAASVYGGANLSPNSAGFQGGIEFPRIPGLNSPLFGFSLFPPLSPPGGGSGGPGGRGPSGPGERGPPSPFGGFPGLPSLPNVNSLIPHIPSGLATNTTGINISGIAPVSSFPEIPGLPQAIQLARDHLNTTLDLGNNFVDGIQLAINQALAENDPTTAVRTLVTTILDTYLGVARNCPMIIIGVRVLQEGIRLAFEVARSVRNVIGGNNS